MAGASKRGIKKRSLARSLRESAKEKSSSNKKADDEAATEASSNATWRRDFVLLVLLVLLLIMRWWAPSGPDEGEKAAAASTAAAAAAAAARKGKGEGEAGVGGAKAAPRRVSTKKIDGELRFPVQCSSPPSPPPQRGAVQCPTRLAADFGGGGAGPCDRVVVDNFLSADDVAALLSIAEKGMAKGGPAGAQGGPTIMDVNSGWVLPAGAHQPLSIYRDQVAAGGEAPLFSSEEYELYRAATGRLKRLIEAKFGLREAAAAAAAAAAVATGGGGASAEESSSSGGGTGLYFTAPTFITREVGGAGWVPSTVHDEYWHPHVDKNNTAHYDYSGLVYLSTQWDDERWENEGRGSADAGADFEGGTLQFFAPDALDCQPFEAGEGPCAVRGSPELEVAPVAGRAIVFGSGAENAHRVTRVTRGTRYVLSFWFTCDARMEMGSFLDGKMHVSFQRQKTVEILEASREL